MQTLDSFISPIPRFEGDISILAIPVSTRSPSDESINDPSAGASAGALKTQTSKWKLSANPPPQKKTKKAAGKSSSGIKINEPVPKASPTSTPHVGFWAKNPNPLIKEIFPLCLSFILYQFVIREPLCKVPQYINPDSSTKSALVGGESPMVTKPPTLNTKETAQESRKPPSLGGTQNSPGAGGAMSSPLRATSSPNPASASSSPEPQEFPRASPTRPRSHGLRAVGGYHPGEGSSRPRSENPPQQYL
jgi:hypothetical protein